MYRYKHQLFICLQSAHRLELKMAKISAILFVLSIAALAAAQPVQEARAVREKNVNDGSGNFQFT